ncbi:hypothetical protein PILCRDRAFT_582831 [Piloderma croceum F 1598]|uniref:Amino acid transporter transmembrane domain-containing protein n=1 Tax=Piloderma croceum (strain F 1598) TaxID=765440 RepID=A0A0C3FFY1_PILCF|nr:hypothetical protein PILCRDRAFT_582831 [Piloderma croceum F 1598]
MHAPDKMTEESNSRDLVEQAITLDQYMYYAKLKRNAEKGGYSGNGIDADGTDVARPSLIQMARNMGNSFVAHKELEQGLVIAMKESQVEATAGLSELEVEKLHARRLIRVVSWSTIFYLITTDILGPFNAPWATANLGLVPGVMLYFFFGLIAGAAGLVLSYLYNKLDSDRYPIKTYGDLAERIGGLPLRHICVVLQGIQLIFTVALALLSAGQSLYQISSGRLCFSICLLIWALIGMIVGQIISLRNVGVLGGFSLYVNLLIVVMSMGVVAHSLPDFEAADAANDTLGTGPVIVKAFNSGQLVEQVGGMFNLVFTFGGAMVFPELMAEMRRPMDFPKGMICAQILISVVYLMYSIFWYCFQGPYTQPNSFQGISPFAWRTTFDAMNMYVSFLKLVLFFSCSISFKGLP